MSECPTRRSFATRPTYPTPRSWSRRECPTRRSSRRREYPTPRSARGELAYEINVLAWYGLALWQAVLAAGEQYGITPYGTDAMHVLRAEKGFPIIGQDTDGTVTPQDLGLAWAVSKKKPDFIGKRSFEPPRESASRP